MVQTKIGKYIWIIDALFRHKGLTKEELNQLWIRSEVDGGEPLPDRTFYHYRRSIEDIFNIEIKCDNRGRYNIDTTKSNRRSTLTNWLMDSMVVSSVISQTHNDTEDRIEIEDVPSAREFLPMVVEAIQDSVKVVFTYAGFSRSRAEARIVFHPYFLKRYKQRWYMIGFKEKGKSLRTYALDRVREMKILSEKFEKPKDVTLDNLFGNVIGVTTSQAPVRTVKLMATPMQAKYFRALPLHPSQEELVNDKYSIFTYKLQLNYELAHEILSMGDAVKVLEPKELEIMVTEQLKAALTQYQTKDDEKG